MKNTFIDFADALFQLAYHTPTSHQFRSIGDIYKFTGLSGIVNFIKEKVQVTSTSTSQKLAIQVTSL